MTLHSSWGSHWFDQSMKRIDLRESALVRNPQVTDPDPARNRIVD